MKKSFQDDLYEDFTFEFNCSTKKASAWQGKWKIYEKTIKGKCSDMTFYVDFEGN